MAKEAAGDEHPSVLRHSVIFGDLQVALGLPDEAMRTLTSAVEALRRILGASNPALAIGLRSLARAEAASHRLTDAERHARESLQIDMRMTKGFSTAVADGHMALAAVLVRSSQLAEAIQHARVGLTTRQRVLGDSHADVSQARIELAQTLELAGHRAEAEAELRLAQAALQGLATVYPQRWELVGSGLASVLLDCGRVDEAEPLAVAALAGASARLPVGHPTIDHLRVLVARVHAAKVPVSPVAVLALEELLASRAAGAETPDTVGAQAMLGRSQFHRGDLDTAERTLRATLAAQERVLPPDSLPWATTLNDLGLVLEAKGVLVEAEQVLQRSLTIYRSRLGDAHEWLANTLASLAKVRLGQGNAPEAERCYREALTMREQLPGEHGPAKARCLHGIGDARRIAGDLPEAATFLRQALDLRRQHFQAPDEEVANNLNTLGMVAMQLGALDEAVPWLREALETYRQLRAPWGRLWPVVINFGMALEASGDAPIAEELYRDQLAIVRGEDHDGIDRANVSAQLGQCLLGQGRADEAEPLLAECYTLRCELMPDDWRRYVAASQLGAALLANGKPTDALPLLLEAVQKMRPPASLADRKLVAMQRLVAAYDAAGKPEEAEAWRQKLAALQPRR